MAPSPRTIMSTSLAAHRRVSPKKFPQDGFERIDESIKVEEETLPFYEEGLFYPVRIGEVIRDQHQVIAKLGYGASSTTWLALDLLTARYVVLKVHVTHVPHLRELEVLQYLKSIQSEHYGREQIRLIEDHFTIQGSCGSHIVFVLPPLGVSVKLLQELQPGGVYKEGVAVSAIQQTILALDFLHHEASVIHTDVHAGNLLLDITDESQLVQFEENERMRPTDRKVIGDRVIHVSQMLMTAGGPPHLCDFGHARICPDSELQTGLIMPTQYRAPEVLLDMQWDFAVDLWSIGILAWDLLEPKSLFQIYDYNHPEINEAFHLAHMVRILGPPPLDFLRRSPKSQKYWDDAGNWKGVVPLPPPATLESLVTSLQGKRKDEFLDFIRGVLQWEPEKRLSTGHAWNHPWISGLEQASEATEK
ncbi:hypothetical protein E4U56_007940 [Claviceps arundinis]|uniref:non-specific serine/threonine protein kinase n=1 Tax=Claviceps arundinis TaxID=1623583 RepID=A0A9P7MTA0_9HYPO|nr:hypothetical protein E4U56_007940 [Claviceps arundinis]